MKKFLIVIFALLTLLLPAPAFAGGLRAPSNLRLDRIECGEKPKAYAYFSWDPFEFATSYRFYSKIADGQDSYRSYGEELTSPSYTFSFNPEFDFYVGVSSVNTFTGNPPSTTESEKTEYFLSAKRVGDLCSEKTTTNEENKTVTPATSPTPTPKLSSADREDLAKSQEKVRQLEEKVNNLEGKVNQVQRKQNILEQLINRILSIFGKK